MPEGFVTQIRFIVGSSAITLRGEELPVRLSSHDQTAKVVPIDGVPFQIVAGERTGARVVFDPFEKVIRSKEQGFKLKPVVEAEYVDIWELSPVLLDRIVVGFTSRVSRLDIANINARIGATVLDAWEPTNYYVMRLPSSVTLEDALDYYHGLGEVAFALPDTLVYPQAGVFPCDAGFMTETLAWEATGPSAEPPGTSTSSPPSSTAASI